MTAIIGAFVLVLLVMWLFQPGDGTVPIVVALVVMAMPAMFVGTGLALGPVATCIGAIAVGELGRAVSSMHRVTGALTSPVTFPAIAAARRPRRSGGRGDDAGRRRGPIHPTAARGRAPDIGPVRRRDHDSPPTRPGDLR